MSRARTFFSSYWHLFVWPVFCAAILLPAAGYYTAFPSPDSAPLFPAHSRWIIFLEAISRTESIALHEFIRLVLPQLVWTDLYYWLTVSAMALAGYWLMRERDVPKIPALFGGGALAFAGYSFTLISAGHRAYFSMLPYEAFTFAALTCAVRRRDLLAYILGGASAAWMFRFGPDVAASLLFVAALYTLWTAFVESRCAVRDGARPFWPRFLLGCVTAGLAFALVAGPSIYHVVTNTVAARKAQIAESSGSALTAKPAETAPAEASATDGGASMKNDDEKWIFATNWSLPPEEVVEFVAPSIYGTWSGDIKAPYWGRLGRSASWNPKRPSQGGFFNFRQHCVYLGSIPVALAIFAFICSLIRLFVDSFARSSVQHQTSGIKNSTHQLATSNFKLPTPFYLFDIFFWSIVGIVALLLAFGRYAPFYRFFYAIPGMSYMRAPVKLMRIVELSVAALSASGLAMLCSEGVPAKAKRVFGIAAAVAAVVCMFHASAISSSKTFASILATLGGQSLMRPMAEHAVHALWHAIIGFALVAGAAFAMAKNSSRARAVASILVAALAVDIAVATRPFLFVQDYGPRYKPNVVTQAVLGARERPYMASVTILGAQQLPEWFTWSLSINRIRRQPMDKIDHNSFLSATRGDMLRMCELTGSEFLAIPASMSRTLDRRRADHVLFFNLDSARVSEVRTPSKNSFELVRVKDVLPYCSLYSKWIDGTEDGWMARVASAPADTLVCAGAGPCANGGDAGDGASRRVGTTRLVAHRGIDGTWLSYIETEAEGETVLLILDRPNDDDVAIVDGVEAQVFKAGYAPYVGVRLSPGRHVVSYGRRHSYRPAFYTIPVLIAVLVLAIRFAARRSREGFAAE